MSRQMKQAWARMAQQICDSEPVITTYAACQFDELSADGQAWLAVIVREAFLHGARAEAFMRDARAEATRVL